MKANGKDAYYFPHDAGARYDPKMQAMMNKHGMAGVGMYWCIVEMLREQPEYKLERGGYMWEAIANQLLSKPEAVLTFVNDCIDTYKLFSSDSAFFWSESLLRRMLHVDEIRAKRSESGKKGGEKKKRKQKASNCLPNGKQSSMSLSLVSSIWEEYKSTIKGASEKETCAAIATHADSEADRLTAAMRRYAAQIKRDGTAPKYRIVGYNFFGRNERWKEFAQDDTPPEHKRLNLATGVYE